MGRCQICLLTDCQISHALRCGITQRNRFLHKNRQTPRKCPLDGFFMITCRVGNNHRDGFLGSDLRIIRAHLDSALQTTGRGPCKHGLCIVRRMCRYPNGRGNKAAKNLQQHSRPSTTADHRDMLRPYPMMFLRTQHRVLNRHTTQNVLILHFADYEKSSALNTSITGPVCPSSFK